MPVIEVEGLRRTYRTRTSPWKRAAREVEAVKGVDFAVERGELFGLLGPNGAGKTTTIKMLITLLLPTSGRASVLGYDVVDDPREVRRRVGYVFGGDRGLYERLSALDNLRYFAELYGVSARDQKARIGELLELVGLTGREEERVEGYSRGMRQRLHVARGLLHKPEVLFLDEPSIGLDPVGARELRTTVSDLRASGTTVLLTTHYMFEADELCDRIAVIAGGRIVAEGTPADLKGRVGEGTVVEVEVFGDAGAALREVQTMTGVRSAAVEDRGHAQSLVVRAEPGAEVTQRVLALLTGVPVGRVATREPTLEDAYVELVGQTAESDAAAAAGEPDGVEDEPEEVRA
ncbi:MAG TPA: ABC transporter ATP-binding protein [Actinomycetes bacterium]